MKKFTAIGIAVVTVLAGAFVKWGWPEWRARVWEARWDTFVAKWEAKGEHFDLPAVLPEPVADEENFFRHPFLQRVFAGEVDWVAIDESLPLNDYDDWRFDSARDEETDDSPAPPMPQELSARVLDAIRPVAADLDAFAEAARRPAASLDIATGTQLLETMRVLSRLSNVSKVLAARAEARIATAAIDDAVDDLVTMIHAARHLRATRTTMGTIIGTGFESAACQMIIDVSFWLPDQRQRLLAAFNLRENILDEAFAAMLRVERNGLLDAFMEDTDLSQPTVRTYVARVRLETCESLQAMVLSRNGERLDRVDGARVRHYNDHWRRIQQTGKSNPHQVLVMAGLQAGIYDALEMRENERDRALRKLRSVP